MRNISLFALAVGLVAAAFGVWAIAAPSNLEQPSILEQMLNDHLVASH